MNTPQHAVFASKIRKEEKEIFLALERRQIPYEYIDSGKIGFHLNESHMPQYRNVLNRSISSYVGLYAMQCFERLGIKTINHSTVIDICMDKLKTSIVLAQHHIPVPKTGTAFDCDSALNLIEEIGYPVVIKPLVGSWGRLLAKVNDRDAAECILEHKKTLGSPIHGIFYIQQFIEKPERDIRILIANDEIIGAMYRRSDHWITNTAKNAVPEICHLDDTMIALTRQAARCVGGGLLAVDLIESEGGQLLVNEINPTMEFKGFEQATGINVADRIVDYMLKECDS